MPIVDGVGFGECTKIKIEHFSKIISMHLAITQAVLAKNKNFCQYYRYIELTAGKGRSPSGEKGSPIAFLELAEGENFKIPYQADFIDCRQNSIAELEINLLSEKVSNSWQGTSWHFHHGTYQEIIPQLLKSKNNEFGMVFIDHSGEMPDFDTLKLIAELRPKMELLIYLPSTNIKRAYKYTQLRLRDLIDIIGKKNWIIRNPIAWDQKQWTFLLGSNSQLFGDYKSIEFYRLESKRGNDILEKLNFTEREQQESKQFPLDFPIK